MMVKQVMVLMLGLGGSLGSRAQTQAPIFKISKLCRASIDQVQGSLLAEEKAQAKHGASPTSSPTYSAKSYKLIDSMVSDCVKGLPKPSQNLLVEKFRAFAGAHSKSDDNARIHFVNVFEDLEGKSITAPQVSDLLDKISGTR